MGWDAFGLPAENAAVQHGVDPQSWTLRNIRDMKRQFHAMHLSFDWPRVHAVSVVARLESWSVGTQDVRPGLLQMDPMAVFEAVEGGHGRSDRMRRQLGSRRPNSAG